MSRVPRAAAVPSEMQGRWVDEEEPSSELIIDGGEVTCFGARVDYDWKEIQHIDGALTVTLGVDGEARQDSFARANITDLVIAPDGAFYGYNVKFSCRFIRAE
ncbi:MAG TPA: hypothetical protein VGC56_04255 [Allosphingosinicella sp.]|jgi:hypothetical protein